MQADDQNRDEVVKDAIDEIRLGDSLANNQDLLNALSGIGETVEADATGTGGWSTKEFLMTAWCDYAAPIWQAARKTIELAAKRFTNIEARKILARSEAKVNQAKAKKIEAEADAIRSAEARKDELLSFLIQQNIDMASEQREDLLRIVFVKPDRIENGTN